MQASYLLAYPSTVSAKKTKKLPSDELGKGCKER